MQQPALRKILVVDDSPTERFFISDLLVNAGYTVLTADNGEEAVRIARLEQPAVVVMDVVMPGLSGFQVTRALARDPATSGIPVIIVSSKDAETDRIWGLRQGARDYLIKPIRPEDLLARVAGLMQGAVAN